MTFDIACTFFKNETSQKTRDFFVSWSASPPGNFSIVTHKIFYKTSHERMNSSFHQFPLKSSPLAIDLALVVLTFSLCTLSASAGIENWKLNLQSNGACIEKKWEKRNFLRKFSESKGREVFEMSFWLLCDKNIGVVCHTSLAAPFPEACSHFFIPSFKMDLPFSRTWLFLWNSAFSHYYCFLSDLSFNFKRYPRTPNRYNIMLLSLSEFRFQSFSVSGIFSFRFYSSHTISFIKILQFLENLFYKIDHYRDSVVHF